jgi:hypothetical protein
MMLVLTTLIVVALVINGLIIIHELTNTDGE